MDLQSLSGNVGYFLFFGACGMGAFAFSLQRSCVRGPRPSSSAEAADAGTPLATASPLCPGAVRAAIRELAYPFALESC
jgi:hypothetical protein